MGRLPHGLQAGEAFGRAQFAFARRAGDGEDLLDLVEAQRSDAVGAMGHVHLALLAAFPLQEEHRGQHEHLHLGLSIGAGDHREVAFHERDRVAGVQLRLTEFTEEPQQGGAFGGGVDGRGAHAAKVGGPVVWERNREWA